MWAIISVLVCKARLEALLEAIISLFVCKARLEALLEAAGISKLAENKELADPDVIKRLTSSVRYRTATSGSPGSGLSEFDF